MLRKKLIPAGIVAVIASLSVVSAASADVPRCQVPVTRTTQATLHVYNPKDTTGQWADVWAHDLAITVNPDGTFVGTGSEHSLDNTISVGVTVTGTIEAGNKISMVIMQDNGGSKQIITSATADATSKDEGTVSLSAADPAFGWPVEARITAPRFEVAN